MVNFLRTVASVGAAALFMTGVSAQSSGLYANVTSSAAPSTSSSPVSGNVLTSPSAISSAVTANILASIGGANASPELTALLGDITAAFDAAIGASLGAFLDAIFGSAAKKFVKRADYDAVYSSLSSLVDDVSAWIDSADYKALLVSVSELGEYADPSEVGAATAASLSDTINSAKTVIVDTLTTEAGKALVATALALYDTVSSDLSAALHSGASASASASSSAAGNSTASATSTGSAAATSSGAAETVYTSKTVVVGATATVTSTICTKCEKTTVPGTKTYTKTSTVGTEVVTVTDCPPETTLVDKITTSCVGGTTLTITEPCTVCKEKPVKPTATVSYSTSCTTLPLGRTVTVSIPCETETAPVPASTTPVAPSAKPTAPIVITSTGTKTIGSSASVYTTTFTSKTSGVVTVPTTTSVEQVNGATSFGVSAGAAVAALFGALLM